MNKELLRKRYLKIRENIYEEKKTEYDDDILKKIINIKEYKECKLLLSYVSLKDEVDTLQLIKYSLYIGKKIAVPKCEGNIMNFYYINSLNELQKGSFGILEPKGNNIVNNFEDSICIVPGVAFDKYNNRIGYGKGFYDRFLSSYKGMKIGLAYKECICDKIDTDEYDIKMDIIICNSKEK